MNMIVISPVKLIDEVKKRPGLYSTEHPADREEKLGLWKEVGAAIFPDWTECNKAMAYDRVLQLQRKWRSLRDAYNRELRARRSGVRVNKRVYMYFKRMSFLGGFDGEISEDNEVYDNEDTFEYNADVDPLVNQNGAIISTVKKRKRRTRKPSVHSDPPEELEMPFPVEIDNETDSDRLFLLSFLPEMRQLPLNIKMWTRAQIANVMQEAVARHYSDGMPGMSDRSVMEIKRQRQGSSD